MEADLEAILKSADNVERSIGEFDDKEFDIPAVESTQTLESILNEPEDDSPLLDGVHSLLQGDAGETGSITSAEGILGDRPRRKSTKRSIRYEQHGSILRHVVLKGVSAQMRSAADRVDAGMPTALAVSSLIAVGTSHGVVLVFDPNQVLKWCLGSTKVGAEYGAVSAISFNKDCSRLLCGFARGQITMWNLSDGKLLRTITDAHPPGTAILNVKFTDDLTIAVSSDSGGSVFELEMKRLIGVRTCESKCLFSGSRGEVCTIEPLHIHHTVHDHPMKDCIVLAMASLSKVIIVTLRPQLKVLFMHPLAGDPSTLPLLAWQFVIIQVSEKDRVVDPVLAFARDQTIYFFQVTCKNSNDIRFAPLQKTTLPYKLLSMTWMNSRTMVVLDTQERAHVLDVRSEEGLEIVDLTDVQLVYSSSFYKSLATGGNVSGALAFAGERACYQSLVTYNGQLVLLGMKNIQVITLRTWQERVDMLVRKAQYEEALALAASFYEGKAKAVVGLTGTPDKRKGIVAQKIMACLDEYINFTMTTQCPMSGKMEELEEFYQAVVPVCVDYCAMMDRTDVLFGRIYEQFSNDPIAQGTFLECLEPYMLSDRLSSITPNVMQDFVDHFTAHGMISSLEQCIVHMDIASLDIHQVVNLCWKHGMYDALFYIYNCGLRDYTTPLVELLTVLSTAVSSGKQLSEQHITLGNKLLVYISCCLAGRAYPLGDIPDDLVLQVKEQVFATITQLHSKKPPADEPVYPHLKTLLRYDTREFLNVLALGFEDPEFQTEEGLAKRQRVVDILLQIMVESVGFTPTQNGCLFTFLARQMGKPAPTIMVNRVLFEQVLESLCRSGEDTRHEERQQALLELLQAGGLQHFDEERLITMATEAQFFRVCELMYEKRRQFQKILACYWNDTARQLKSFRYIQDVMNDSSYMYTITEKTAVRREAIANIQVLVGLDSQQAAALVLGCLACNITEVVNLLRNDEKTLFVFMQGLFQQREFLSGGGDRVLDAEIHELYVELMCKQKPENVLSYLKSADGYRLEETLQIVREHEIMDATAYMLEKAGDSQGAFDILHSSLLDNIQRWMEVAVKQPDEEGLASQWTDIEQQLAMVVQLCQRSSGKLKDTEREALWFPLLDSVLVPQRRWKEQLTDKHIQAFKDLTREVLNGMMGYVGLPSVLQKIMQDSSYSGIFGELRELILSMLDTYNYEKTLLHCCTRLVNHDLHQQLAALTAVASRGTVPKTTKCSLCTKSLLTPSEQDLVIAFRCGHGYHVPCLRSTGSKVTVDGEESWICYLCNSSKRSRLPSSSPAGRFQRQTSASSHSPLIKSGHITAASSEKQAGVLEPEQILAIDALRRAQRTSFRLASLSDHEHGSSPHHHNRHAAARNSNSILHNEHFQLRVAHPPPDFVS